MLNFQIRGYKLESCIGSLSKFDFSDMINCIKLENLILKEEKRIKKKGRLWLIKRLAIVWGIGFLPFQ